MSDTELKQRLLAILAADVYGYSRLMAGDERSTVCTLDKARRVFRNRIEALEGRVIDMAGDSVLAVFGAATAAVSAALAIQDELGSANADVPEDRRMRFRIGVHLGDVFEKADGTVYGDGVNTAARLEALAEPGGLTISESIRTAVRGRLGVTFVDQGEQRVKNITHPVHAWRIRPGSSDASETSASPQTCAAESDAPATPPRLSIAVLPFANLSGDAEQEHFCDGLTEDIITELSRFKSFFVIARNSTFSYKGRSPDVRLVGRELGVCYVLEGSIRRSADRIRVTAQLIDAASGSHVWAERYDRVLEDVFDVQEELTRTIVGVLEPRIENAEIARIFKRKPASLGAFDLAVKAWSCAREAYAKADPALRERAVELAHAALALDAACSVALSTLAFAMFQKVLYRFGPDVPGAWAKGMAVVEQALALDRQDHRFHAWKGLLQLNVVGGEPLWDEALDNLRKAHSLCPGDPTILVGLGYAETAAGNPEQAIRHLTQVRRIDPVDPASFNSAVGLSLATFVAADYEAAQRWATLALRDAPNLAQAHVYLALASVGLGDRGRAAAALARARELAPGYIAERLDGAVSNLRREEHRIRYRAFLRIAAGLDDPEVIVG